MWIWAIRICLFFQSKSSTLKFFNLIDFDIMMVFCNEWLYAFKYFTEHWKQVKTKKSKIWAIRIFILIFQSKFSLLKFLNVINFLNLIFVDVSGGAVQGDQEEWECSVCEGGRVPAHQTRQVSALPRQPPALSGDPGLALIGGHTRDSGPVLPQPLRCARASLKWQRSQTLAESIPRKCWKLKVNNLLKL